jgi:hypothetical protein
MARLLFKFLVAFIVIGGSYRNVCAQDQPESREGQIGPKPSKTKLFEVPGFGGKISQGAFGEVFDALRDKKVQQEVGLLPSQLKDLQRLSEDVMKELEPTVDNFNKLSKVEQEVKIEQLRKDLASYMKSVQADVDNILVPEQQQRLRQVAFQMRLQKNGSIVTLTSPDVLRELGLNDVQVEQFRENLKKVEEQHRSKLAELETEKERKILALFSPNQRDRLESMIGTSMRNLSKPAVGTKSPQP